MARTEGFVSHEVGPDCDGQEGVTVAEATGQTDPPAMEVPLGEVLEASQEKDPGLEPQGEVVRLGA